MTAVSDSCQITPTSADYLCLDAGKPDAEPIVRVRALESGVDDAVPRDVYLELFARVRLSSAARRSARRTRPAGCGATSSRRTA